LNSVLGALPCSWFLLRSLQSVERNASLDRGNGIDRLEEQRAALFEENVRASWISLDRSKERPWVNRSIVDPLDGSPIVVCKYNAAVMPWLCDISRNARIIATFHCTLLAGLNESEFDRR